MDKHWKTVDVYVPSACTAYEVHRHVRSTIRVIASEAGEFVDEITLGAGVRQADGWCKWCVHYLPCAPGVFRDQSLNPVPFTDTDSQQDHSGASNVNISEH